MNKMNFKISFFFVSVLAFFVSFNQSVLAKNEVDVEDVSGNDIDGKYIFNESNVYPGWYQVKTIDVENESNSKVDLYITFKLDNGEKLAGVLKVYAIRKSDNAYKIGGVGDEFTLLTANNKELFVEKLEAGESQKYYIVLEFDKNAGNEYQNLTTQFDVDFTIEGKTAKNDSETEEQTLSHQNRVVSGQAPAGTSFDTSNNEVEEQISLNTTPEEPKVDNKEEKKPVVSEKKDEGMVAGEQVCQDQWPFWVWILIVLVYVVLVSLIGGNTETKDENKMSLIWQTISLILALVIWYFFDNCRSYFWVPIIEIIGGLVLAVIFYKNEERV